MPEGVVMVLDLLVVAPLLVVVDDLVMPAGFCMVLDLVVVVRVAGACAVEVRVDILVELELILLVEAGGVAWVGTVAAGVWAKEAEPPNRLREKRKPRMRFIRSGNEG